MATQLNEWLSIDKTSGTGNAEITLTASSYEELVERTTSLKIQGISANAILTVKQEALVPQVTITPSVLNMDAIGGSDTITITSNVDLELVSDVDWITISNNYPTDGTTNITIIARTNVGGIRFGNIRVLTFVDKNEIAQITITQNSEGEEPITDKYFWVEFDSTGAQLGGLTNSVVNFIYSFDGETWETAPSTLSMGENKKVFLQNSTKILRTDSVTTKLRFSTYVKIGGDMSSIVDMAEDCCDSLFERNNYLTDASNLVLPWQTLETSCFNAMFFACKNLQYPPIIKATKLGVGSCEVMFGYCTSLLRTPILLTPSNNFIPRAAYSRMFTGCTSLIEACDLNALKVGDSGYYEMFSDCTSLETAPYINAEVLCYTEFVPDWPTSTGKNMTLMFAGCTKLTNVQSVLKPNILEGCYAGMYMDCTSLEIAPALPQYTLQEDCYYKMFDGCTRLNYVKMLGSGDYEEIYIGGSPRKTPISWFLNDVKTRQGTFVKHPDSIITVGAATGGGIPNGWTVETATE